MKTFSFSQLRALVKEQGYKMAALQNPEGTRIVPFNQYKKGTSNLDAQFKIFQTRLKSELNPDGVYFVLLSHTIKAAQNPDSYPIVKGKLNPDQLNEFEKKNLPLTPSTIVIEKPSNVLSMEKFFEMQNEMVKLKGDNAELKAELAAAHKEIAELESDPGLSEGPQANHAITFTKEVMPSLIPMVDKFFSLEEKKLDVRIMELNQGKKNGHKAPDKGTKRKEILPGSQDHLNLIQYWYESTAPEAEDKLNTELDKLGKANPKAYQTVIEALRLVEDEPEQEEEETND